MVWGVKSKADKKPKSVKKTKAASSEAVPVDFRKIVGRLEKSVPLPPKQQLYRFLEKVYREGRLIKLSNNQAAQDAMHLELAPHLRMKVGFNRFRILLEASARHLNPKTRDRYARALQAAHKAQIKGGKLTDFIEKQGGVNKLGDAALKKTPKIASNPSKAEASPRKVGKPEKRIGNGWTDDDEPQRPRTAKEKARLRQAKDDWN